jgi:hypothetical protein
MLESHIWKLSTFALAVVAIWLWSELGSTKADLRDCGWRLKAKSESAR